MPESTGIGASPDVSTTLPLPFEPVPAIFASVLQDDALLADNHGKRIGILIVTYNALATLTKVLKRITPQVWNNVEEIAVFDDASQDSTHELAFGLKALRQLNKLQVLKHARNLGYGGNQKAGYQYFMDKGFDIVVLLHGDGQYAPEVLSRLYHPIVAGEADAVFGSRMMKTFGGPIKGGMPLYKYVGNRILSVFENRSLGLSLTEFHSGYRAYNLHALRNIDFTHMTNDFHFDTEIIIKLHHQHYKIREVPIPTYYGTEICYVNGLKYARDIARAVYRYKQTCRSVRRHSEFQEYYIKYPIKQGPYSSDYYAKRMVGSNQEVLDIGCSERYLSADLTETNNQVRGMNQHATLSPGSVCRRYFCADLEQGIRSLVDDVQGKQFDRVLLLDVLEHLKRPEEVLGQCHAVLKKDGCVLISVPNAANLTVRWMLLRGRFDYAERGILDQTHLRFFTRRTARRLLLDNGYEVLKEELTVMPVELLISLPSTNWFLKLLYRFLRAATWLMPGLFGYEIMCLARSTRRNATC